MTAAFVVLLLVVSFLGITAFTGAPYVPSKRKDAARLLEHLKLSPQDTLLDIGSGDGVVLRLADARGAVAVGYELHPFFVVLSKLMSHRHKRVRVRLANMWRTPFPNGTTVVYIFSVGRDSTRLERLLQKEATRLGRPLRVACYGNSLPGRVPEGTFEAYYLYKFTPLH